MRTFAAAVASLLFVLPAQAAPILGQEDALAVDAAEWARTAGIAPDEALRRLRAQEASVPATDAIAARFADRLAGISIEHRPQHHILVRLTGDEPVRDGFISAGGSVVPVNFVTGAPATRAHVVAAIRTRGAALRAAFPRAQGMGLDPRTGELVLMLPGFAGDRAETEARVSELAGLRARIRIVGDDTADLALEGGARIVGNDPRDGRRYACTTGFVVADASRTGVATAAHCPDAVTYKDPALGDVPLDFVGQWGVSFQDVQVHVGQLTGGPFFYADTAKSALRTVTGARPRAATRAGDIVCHRGETSGYSCAEVELVDYAPPGDLCAGPCDPSWVTVAGPVCRHGDSGGPVFVGSTAFGITKGGTYDARGRCAFYFYMSTDYLPDGWTLVTAQTS